MPISSGISIDSSAAKGISALLSMLIPLLIGMLWGNLDERFKQLCAAAQPLVIIIMSFAIGANSSIYWSWRRWRTT